MALVRDPRTGELVDDGQPVVVYAPGDPRQPQGGPPIARIGSQPMPAPDDVGPNDVLTGNLLTAQTGAAVQAQNAARAAAAAAPTATGGAVVPSLTHGLPVSPVAPPPDLAQPGAAPVAVVPPVAVPPHPAPVVAVHHAGGAAHAPGTPGMPPPIPSDQKERDALGEGREDLLKDKGSLAARQADIASGTAEGNADLEAKYQGLGDTERARFQQEFQKRTADRDAAIEAAAKAKPHSYFSNMGVAGGIVTTLALATGALGAGLSAAGGHPTGNMALQQLNRQIDDDFERQKYEIQNLKDVAAMKRTGVTDAVQAHKILDDDLKDKKAGAYASLIADGERRLKALGRTQAEIDSNVALNDLKQKLLDDRRQRVREDASDTLNRLTVGSNLETAKSVRAKNYAEANAAGITAKAALAKAQGIDEKDVIRDRTGNPIGIVGSGRGGAQGFATRDANFSGASRQLQALLADIAQNGESPRGVEAIRRRQGLEQAAKLAITTVSTAPQTKETMEAEGATIGVPGTGLGGVVSGQVLGSNPALIQRKLDDIKRQQLLYRRETLRPLSGNGIIPDNVLGQLGDEPAPAASPPPGTPFKLRDGRTGTINAQGKHQLANGTVLD